MGTKVNLELPWPPSVNSYWKHRVVGNKPMVYLSAEAVKFRQDVKSTVKVSKKFTGRLKVTVSLYAPNKRSYDLDNKLKGTLDSLTHAGVWNDDEQVDILIVKRIGFMPNGMCIVDIEEIEQ